MPSLYLRGQPFGSMRTLNLQGKRAPAYPMPDTEECDDGDNYARDSAALGRKLRVGGVSSHFDRNVEALNNDDEDSQPFPNGLPAALEQLSGRRCPVCLVSPQPLRNGSISGFEGPLRLGFRYSSQKISSRKRDESQACQSSQFDCFPKADDVRIGRG
ncbi:hypothetical protein ALO95_200126 [Pseudomonas syringae pv. antirrhini]|nr:hypothetical protein ALO95_200126 [Pseudomonas syringae pv. antirrhini]